MRPADLEQPELLAVDVNVAHLLLFPLLVAALVCTHTHHVKLSDELSVLCQTVSEWRCRWVTAEIDRKGDDL